MKVRHILGYVGAFVVGTILGGVGTFAYSGKTQGESLVSLRSIELRKSADSACQAYKTEDRGIGVWALNQHLKLIDELREMTPPETWQLGTHAMITHARLAKLHASLGNPKKKAEHLEEAIALAKGSSRRAFENIVSEDALWAVLEKFDERNIP